MRADHDEYGEPRKSGGGSRALLLIVCVLVVIALAGAVWYFLGNRETTAAVTEKYRPRFAEHRSKLKRIAEKLPAPGTVQGEALDLTLDPKPVYDVPNKTFNIAIVMAAHCENPERELKSPGEVDLLFHDDEFRTHLLWTGDRSPLAESARNSRAKDLAKRFERSLNLRYLVVGRATWFSPIKVIGENFTGGQLDLEVFFFDYQSEKLLGSCVRRYGPDQKVMVTFRKDRKENESAEEFIYSNIWSKARVDVAGTLAFGTRGTFDIDPAKR